MRTNAFVDTDVPLTIAYHADLSKVALVGSDSNTFTGNRRKRTVVVNGSAIADGPTWTVSGVDSRAVLAILSPITASHSLLVDNGDVTLLPGTIVKGITSLFDLGPHSDFWSLGTATHLVIHASDDDDLVGGDTMGDGDAHMYGPLPHIFRPDQEGGDFVAIVGAIGIDISQGPVVIVTPIRTRRA